MPLKNMVPRISRKRINADSLDGPAPKRKYVKKKMQNKHMVDKYCWICHDEVNRTHQDLDCRICPRIYHYGCLATSETFTAGHTCIECRMESVCGRELTKRPRARILQECLKVVQDIVSQKNTKYHIFEKWSAASGKIVRAVDFEYLMERVYADIPYKKTAEFYSDVKWIYHNCAILYAANSQQVKTAKELLKDYQIELMDIEACFECYYHMYSDSSTQNDFVRICHPPHDIIWAKMTGYAYWPAKCLYMDNNKKALVKYFGEHERYQMNASKCYRISKEHPEKQRYTQPKNKKGHPNSAKYIAAMDELEKYIILCKRKGISFKYYESRTPYKLVDPRNMDDQQTVTVAELPAAAAPVPCINSTNDSRIQNEELFSLNGVYSRRKRQIPYVDPSVLIPYLSSRDRLMQRMCQEVRNASDNLIIRAWALASHIPEAGSIIIKQKNEIDSLQAELNNLQMERANLNQEQNAAYSNLNAKIVALQTSIDSERQKTEHERQKKEMFEAKLDQRIRNASLLTDSLESRMENKWAPQIEAIERKANQSMFDMDNMIQRKCTAVEDLEQANEALERLIDPSTMSIIPTFSQETQTD